MKKPFGFVVIEMMVVLAILGILLAVIVPDYLQYQLRSYRLEAKQELYRLAGLQQDYYLQNRQYSVRLSVFEGLQDSYLTPSGRFRIQLQAQPTGYLIQAQAVGVQQRDSDCQQFSLDHLNQRQSGPSAVCWQ